MTSMLSELRQHASITIKSWQANNACLAPGNRDENITLLEHLCASPGRLRRLIEVADSQN